MIADHVTRKVTSIIYNDIVNSEYLFLEEERISISLLIGDQPNNWPLTEMTDLMEILGLEEYFKTKVILSLANSLFEIGFQLFVFSWNR